MKVDGGAVRMRLRAATRDRHDRMERVMDLPRRLATRASLAAMLDRIHGFYVPLEARLAALPWAPAGLAFDERRKAGWLVDDLLALGARPSGATCTRLPVLDTLTAGLGSLYVLEGATLGGQLIARELARLGVDAAHGGRFFASYGAEVGPRWRQFVDVLETHCAGEVATDAAIEAAAATFDRYGDWMLGLDAEAAGSADARLAC